MEHTEIQTYIDKSIEINFPLTFPIQIVIQELEKAHKNNDWIVFDMWVETLEADCKEAIIDGLLTEEQMNLLLNKYYSE